MSCRGLGHKEKKSVSFAAVTPAANSQAEHTFSCCAASDLLRTRSVPDVVGTNPASSATTQNLDLVCASSIRFLTPRAFGRGGFSKSKNTMRMTNSQPDLCRGASSKPNELRQTYSPSDRLAAKEPGRRKEQVVRREGNVTEWDGNPEGSLKKVSSSRTSFCSCIHFDVPLRSVCSVMFLVKSLCISLEDIERSPTLQRSTLSLRLGVSAVKKYKQTATNTNHRRASYKCSGQESGALSGCRGLQSKRRGRKVEQIAPPAYGVNSKAHDSATLCNSATPGLLSFRGPSQANVKAARQKGNADEAVQTNRTNFKHSLHSFHSGPESRSWDRPAESIKKEEELECDGTTKLKKMPSLYKDKTCYYHSQLKDESGDGAAKSLSLQEALELFRPDFISRSQSRVKRVEQRARRRRALHGSNPDLVHGLREDRGKQKRNCTTPDPLSDNLFKPRERSISGREMQLRSRRIYNMLPEVTKKKEEEKRRAVSQTNRLRAEVFKRKLLDQVLQR